MIFLFNNKFYQKGKDVIKMRLKRNFQHDFDGQMKAFTIIYKRIHIKVIRTQLVLNKCYNVFTVAIVIVICILKLPRQKMFLIPRIRIPRAC